jgi:hypothetical protein
MLDPTQINPLRHQPSAYWHTPANDLATVGEARQPSEAARYLHRWITITCVSCAAIGLVALAIAYLGMR